MFRMQNPDIGQEADREKFDNVQKFVRELLKNEELKIQIPNTKDKIIIEMNGERLPLSHLGTGIHQLVILCCALEIFTDTIFCIEEPEIHLHPELQRKFLDLLKRTQNRYFITTHSNVFLDYDDNVSIYHVTHDGEKSKVTNINNSKHNHDILDDLGYKNSDILQANGIIWVEGPSDRVFLNHWLHLKRPDLIEGLHYSILFYGGRLLSNLSYSPDFLDKTLIPLLKINRNAYVIIDKDGKKITDKLNATKTRIKNEIGDYKCWITKGREIENYLSESTIKKWLKEKTKKELHFEYSHQEKLENSIKAANISGVEIKYEKNKNAFSKELVKYIEYADFKTLDLEAKIDEIIRWIDKWNG
jgi:predicted ATP-dependent endonuclease of OLD family